MPGTRKLGRTTEHRMAMLKGMVTLLLENGQIVTTLTRAKQLAQGLYKFPFVKSFV